MGYDTKEKTLKNTSKMTIEDVLKLPCIRVAGQVPLEAAKHFEIRSEVSEENGVEPTRTYFPYFSQNGKLAGYKVRDWRKAKSDKYHFTTIGNVTAQCKMFGQHKYQTPPKKVICVEGETDCAVAWYTIDRYCKSKGITQSYAIVGLPAGCANADISASANESFLLGGQELIFALDNDERLPHEKANVIRGKDAERNMFSVLLSGKIKKVTWPEGNKDARDYATKCLQDKNEKAFYDLVLYGGEKYNGTGVIKPSDIGFEEFIKPIPKGVMVESLPKTMDLLYGIRKSELTLITGPSGCGKSSITAELLHYFAREGYRSGVIFLEEIARKTLQRLGARYLEINYKDFKFDPTGVVSRERLQEAWDWIDDPKADRFSLVNHFGALAVNDLMAKVKYMVYVERRDFIVLDHLSMLTADNKSEDERRAIDAIMAELSAFVASNDVGLICVAHINREASKVRPPQGKEDEPFWVKVRATDLRGSAGLEQMSWNIIGLESEWMPDRTRGRLRTVVLKNREAAEMGEGDILKQNPQTGLLEDASHEDEVKF